MIELLNDLGMVVMVEANNGAELNHLLKGSFTHPDIILLDIKMPIMNGFDTLSEIRSHWPGQKVVTSSILDNEFTVIRMIQLGVNSYLTKDASAEEIKNCIESVHFDGYYYSYVADARLFREVQRNKYPFISDRELLFLWLCSSTLNFAEIAHQMCLSISSIEKFQFSISEKIGIKNNRLSLAMFAKDAGIC